LFCSNCRALLYEDTGHYCLSKLEILEGGHFLSFAAHQIAVIRTRLVTDFCGQLDPPLGYRQNRDSNNPMVD
jgi:hypothetical protein